MNNLKLGSESLKHNSKYQNTALGIESLKASRTGINNTAVGYRSLKNAHNNSNTAIGSFAGEVLQIGNSNILIGSKADVSSKASINQIVIGANAKGHGDNIMVLGNRDTKSIEPEGKKTDLGSNSHSFDSVYAKRLKNKDSISVISDGGDVIYQGRDTIFEKKRYLIDKNSFGTEYSDSTVFITPDFLKKNKGMIKLMPGVTAVTIKGDGKDFLKTLGLNNAGDEALIYIQNFTEATIDNANITFDTTNGIKQFTSDTAVDADGASTLGSNLFPMRDLNLYFIKNTDGKAIMYIQ